MGIIEIVGYAGDGDCYCLECIKRDYREDQLEPIGFKGSFDRWTKEKGFFPIFDTDDFGSDGLRCGGCGEVIKPEYEE